MANTTKKVERAAREKKRRLIRNKLKAKQAARRSGARKTKTHPHRRTSALRVAAK